MHSPVIGPNWESLALGTYIVEYKLLKKVLTTCMSNQSQLLCAIDSDGSEICNGQLVASIWQPTW